MSMDANEKIIAEFTTRVRQMLLRFEELKQENLQLSQKIDERDEEISELKAKLDQAHTDYDNLKLARMVEVTDADMDKAQKRLAKLIRDVNTCITLISEK